MVEQLKLIGKKAQKAARWLSQATPLQKNQGLLSMAKAIEAHQQTILDANSEDIRNAESKQFTAAFLDRLTLSPARIEAMIASVNAVSQLPDPVNRILAEWQVPSGLTIRRISMPLGVIGVIYEARPNVTADAASLCFKAGNAVILRGGSECLLTNQAILAALKVGLQEAGIPDEAIQMVPSQDRAAVSVMLSMKDEIDVIIPRGGQSLIKRVIEESKIPIFQHLQGLCHTYIHEAANITMAEDIVINAKMRRTGICGATETLLVDKVIAASLLPNLINRLIELGCQIRGCETTQSFDSRVILANEIDWATEYLDAILSIRVVNHIDEAIQHIQRFSSSHTEAIISEDKQAVEHFMACIDSSIVMHNASTQFADGGEFGMGAEIGISTGKLHARGPVGVEQLTTFRYQVFGSGQTRNP